MPSLVCFNFSLPSTHCNTVSVPITLVKTALVKVTSGSMLSNVIAPLDLLVAFVIVRGSLLVGALSSLGFKEVSVVFLFPHRPLLPTLLLLPPLGLISKCWHVQGSDLCPLFFSIHIVSFVDLIQSDGFTSCMRMTPIFIFLSPTSPLSPMLTWQNFYLTSSRYCLTGVLGFTSPKQLFLPTCSLCPPCKPVLPQTFCISGNGNAITWMLSPNI